MADAKRRAIEVFCLGHARRSAGLISEKVSLQNSRGFDASYLRRFEREAEPGVANRKLSAPDLSCIDFVACDEGSADCVPVASGRVIDHVGFDEAVDRRAPLGCALSHGDGQRRPTEPGRRQRRGCVVAYPQRGGRGLLRSIVRLGSRDRRRRSRHGGHGRTVVALDRRGRLRVDARRQQPERRRQKRDKKSLGHVEVSLEGEGICGGRTTRCRPRPGSRRESDNGRSGVGFRGTADH